MQGCYKGVQFAEYEGQSPPLMSGSVCLHSTNLPGYITQGCIVIGQLILIINYFLPQSLSPAKRKFYQRREYKCICLLKVGVGKVPKRESSQSRKRNIFTQSKTERVACLDPMGIG